MTHLQVLDKQIYRIEFDQRLLRRHTRYCLITLMRFPGLTNRWIHVREKLICYLSIHLGL